MSKAAQVAIENGVTPVEENVTVPKDVLEKLLQEVQELKEFKQEQTKLAKEVKSQSIGVSKEDEAQSDVDAWLNERVQITLFKDGEKYKDDVTVNAGGEIIQIQRGKPVEIKRKHYLIIEASMAQQIKAAEFEESIVANYEAEIKSKLE